MVDLTIFLTIASYVLSSSSLPSKLKFPKNAERCFRIITKVDVFDHKKKNKPLYWIEPESFGQDVRSTETSQEWIELRRQAHIKLSKNPSFKSQDALLYPGKYKKTTETTADSASPENSTKTRYVTDRFPISSTVRDISTNAGKLAFFKEHRALQALKNVDNVASIFASHASQNLALFVHKSTFPKRNLNQLDLKTGKRHDFIFYGPAYADNRQFNIILALTNSLRQIHGKGVAHLSINPKNILQANSFFSLHSDEIRFIGFGHAAADLDIKTGKISKKTILPLTTCNDVIYTPPEILTSETVDNLFAVDVYAMGIVLYKILTGELPLMLYSDDGKPLGVEIPKNIREKVGSFEFVIKGMLVHNPNDRITAYMAHRFLSGFAGIFFDN